VAGQVICWISGQDDQNEGQSALPFRNYYEFGTGWGGTLAAFMLAAEQIPSTHGLSAEDFRVFAFDTFEGLPPSAHPAD
jgi:hypothetical protein